MEKNAINNENNNELKNYLKHDLSPLWNNHLQITREKNRLIFLKIEKLRWKIDFKPNKDKEAKEKKNNLRGNWKFEKEN